MPFDYKKEYKEFYLPPQKPQLLEVPPMNYVAVRGHGDPNAQDGEYQAAIGMLYAVAFTIKMSYKGTHQIPGYFEYVVPPLEGLWWQEGQSRVDYAHKETFSWINLSVTVLFVRPLVPRNQTKPSCSSIRRTCSENCWIIYSLSSLQSLRKSL